jgi:hypothetical protein
MDLKEIPTPDDAKWHHLETSEVARLLGCEPDPENQASG